MKNKLMKARRFFVLGVMAVFVFAGRVGVNAQELSLADEDMQYNAGMKAISADGDMSDWSGLPVKKSIPFEKGGELVLFEEYGGGTWSGPSDHTSSVAFAWDVENLYIGVVVTDDTHQNGNSGWNGDSIQAVFANAAQDAVTHLYNYALSDGGDVVIHNEKGPGGTELAVTRDDDSGTTSYEIALPAASLGLDSYELGMEIGVGLCVNDGDTDDGQGGQKGWSGWGPYAAVYGKTASATGLVSLTAKHDPVPAKPLLTKLLDFGGDEEAIGGVTGQASPAPWISITKLVMDEAHDLGDGVSITALDDGFNPNNPAPPNEDAEYDGIVVPQEARNDYLFKITDTAGTEARMQIDGLPAGKYNITLFEGRTSDAAQFAKVWVGDDEPEGENTGDFAKGSATVEVTVAGGQALWYKHLEDNSGGISGIIIRQTSAPVGLSPLLVDLVSHWPLDEISGETTPDVISGKDMSLTNLDDSSVVEGKVGNAFSFSNADQTLLSYISEGEGDDLPINKHDSFTISMWSRVQGSGQNDLRLFSESNTEGNNNPLFNIGTKNNGSDGTIDIYIRGAGPTVGHIFSTAEPFDGEWHHVVFVQNDLERSIYVDGELDDLEIAAKPESGWDDINATTIGGILRGNASHWVTGELDEVALWKRALSAEEIASVFTGGIPDATGGASTPLVPGMIAYWSFDDASAIDGDQLVVDAVNGIQGVVNGSTSSGDGHVGGAIDFGEDPTGNWVSVEADEGGSWLTPVSDANQLSVAFWQKNHSVGSTSSFWFGAASANNGERNAQAHLPWGGGTIFWDTAGCCGADTRVNQAWGGDYLEWNHYVFIKNEDVKQIYINGELFLEGENNGAFKDDWTVTAIGSNNVGGINVAAMMDEFGVWAKGLTAAEVATIYNGGKGTSLMIQNSGAIALPYISKITKGAGGFGIMVTDEATVGVDPDSVVVSLDGTEVTVDTSKADGVTSVTYTAVDLLASESEHIVNLSYVGTDGQSRSFEKTIKIKAYTLIDPTNRVPDTMKGESGFLVYATQISSGQGVSQLHGNSWQAAEKQIRGEYIDKDLDEPYLNEADPESFDGWSYMPAIVEWVNQNEAAPGEIGNFKASNGYEDEPLTGIPGWGDSTDGIASEYLTMLELPAGSHTFGVNSDDGFSATFGANYLDVQQQQVGLFNGGRGSADSTFTFYVKEAGLYPFRVSWWEGTGGANIEIFSKIGKEKVLINDRDVEGAIKAWAPKDAIVDESTFERASTGRAYISSIGPKGFTTDSSIALTVVNGSVSSLDEGSVKVTVDGEVVGHSVSSDGDARTIGYDVSALGEHTVSVSYDDSLGNSRTVDWGFTLAEPLVDGAVNLLAHWGFDDELDATQSVDSVNGIVAEFKKDAKITTDAVRGHALDASGTAFAEAEAEFLNLASSVNQATFAFWQKWTAPRVSSSSFWAHAPSSPSGERGAQAHAPWGGGDIFWDTAGCCGGGDTRINKGWGGDYHQWQHFAFVKNGDTKQIFINGQLLHEGENTNPLPNDFYKLTLMSGQNGGNSAQGLMDDFAIFASGLDEEQLADVMTGKLLGAKESSDMIAVQPTDVSAEKNMTATFSLELTSTDGVSVVWKQDGVQIGSGASVETAVLTEDDNDTKIQATVMSADSYQYSDEVTLTVTADKTPPLIVSTDSSFLMDSFTIVFNELLGDVDASSFSIDGLSVEGAELEGDSTVIVSTGLQSVDQVYTVAISGLEDAGGNALNTSVDIQAQYYAWVDGEPNLIMFYDFDDTSVEGKAFDNVFNAAGTLSEKAKYTDDTPTGSGNAVDMTSAGDGNVHVADASVLNIASAVDQLTVSFWQKTAAIPNSSSFYANSRTVERAFQAHTPWSNGQIFWDTVGCCGADTQRINADATDIGGWGERLGEWVHYAFVKSGEEKYIYVDGEYFHDGLNSLPLPNDIFQMYIGSGSNGNSSANAIIDDFAVFASALDEDQIIALAEGDSDNLLPGASGDPLLISASATDLGAIEVILHKRSDSVSDPSLSVNGQAVETSVATDGNTVTLTGTASGLAPGEATATVSFNGISHSWTFTAVEAPEPVGHQGVDITSAGDVVVPTSTNSPGGEQAPNAIDNNTQTKYLNFDGKNNTPSGLTISTGSGIVTGLGLTSANDAPERDPATYIIWGSNDGENFTEISSGDVPAFGARFERQTVSFDNDVAYTDYKIHFPTTATSNGCCMQIAEIELLSNLSDLTDITSPGDGVVPTSTNSPGGEQSPNAIDDNDQTKYLNFDGKNNTSSGLTVSTAGGVVKGIALTSANDAPERDPATYIISGSNDGENFTEISSGDVPAFGARFERQTVWFDNDAAYTDYKIDFPTTATSNGCCMQVAEIELLGIKAPALATPPALSIVNNGDGTVTVTFEGKLQAAATVDGPWADVDAASPLTIEATEAMQYARAVND